MAPSNKKRTDLRPWQERSVDTRRSRRSPRKRTAVSRRSWTDERVNEPELYGLLGIDKHNQASMRERSPASVNSRQRRRKTRAYRHEGNRPYETTPSSCRSRSLNLSGRSMDSETTSTDSLTEAMDTANSSEPASSVYETASSTVENRVSPTAGNDSRFSRGKKSFVRIVDRYIRAATEEGKRQARKYIRKALSFGINSGYLIPGDSKGKVLHVTRSLISSNRRASRERRRRVRRGEMDEGPIDRRALRRGTWPVRKVTSRSDVSNDEVIPNKRRKIGTKTQRNKSNQQAGTSEKRNNAGSSSNVKAPARRTTKNSNKTEEPVRKQGNKQQPQKRSNKRRGRRSKPVREKKRSSNPDETPPRKQNDDAIEENREENFDEYHRNPNDKRNRSPNRMKDTRDEANPKIVTERQRQASASQLDSVRMEEQVEFMESLEEVDRCPLNNHGEENPEGKSDDNNIVRRQEMSTSVA